MRGLEVLRANIVMAKLVSRDFDYEPGWKGKALNIPYPGTFTASSKSADTPATVQTPSNGTSTSVSLSHHEYVDVVIEDSAQAQANANLLEKYAPGMAKALAEKLEADLLALYSGVTAKVGTAGTDLDYAAILSAKKTLTDNLVAQNPRYLVISTKDENALLQDTSLTSYFAFAKSQSITDGALARIGGFDIFVSQLVPEVAGTPVDTKNLAFGPEAFILAVRPFAPIPPNAGVDVAIANDPASGLSLRVTRQWDASNKGMRVGMDILYGCALLRDVAAVVVDS